MPVTSSKTPEKSFRQMVMDARPDVVRLMDSNKRKRSMAMKLRLLRKARGMTQADVAEASGMSETVIADMEAPSGRLPAPERIERYVEVVISSAGADKPLSLEDE